MLDANLTFDGYIVEKKYSLVDSSQFSYSISHNEGTQHLFVVIILYRTLL